MTDARDEKQTFEKLQESEIAYRTLAENIPDIVYRVYLQGTGMRFFNNRIFEISGFTAGELEQGRVCSLESRIVEEDRTRVVETVQQAIRNHQAFEVEYRFRHKNGTIITFLERGSIIYDGVGAPLFIDGVIRDVTERKRIEEALRASRSRYQAIVDSQAEFVVRYQPGGIITFVNDTLCRYTNMKRKDLLGRSYYPFMHPDDRGEFIRKIEALDHKAPVMVAEARVVLPDGRESWHSWTHHAIFDNQGTLTEYQATGRDVTEQKRAEAELQEKENKYRQLFEAASDGIFIQDSTGFRDCNQRGAEMYGLTKEEIIGRSPVEFAPERQPDGRLSADVADEKVQAALNGIPQVFEWQPLRADGTPFDVEITLSRLEFGGSVYLQAIVRDITERKQVQEALRKSERMLQTIIDAEPECVKVLDENACLIMMNRAGLGMLQADSLDQVKGQCVCPLVTSEYRPAFMDLTKRIFQGESGTLLFEMVGMKGRHLWLETHAVPLRNEKDKIIALLGVTRDVTERKLAEEALRQSEGRFRSIIENASSGILVAETETRKFRYANPQICRMLGYDADELLELDVASIHPSSELPLVKKAFAAREGVQTLCLCKDGTVFPVEIRTVELELDGRRCLVGFFSDMTERRLLEEERLKAQKLESIGTLAGGIAHDFNNLLQGVFGYISMAKLTIDQREKSLAMLAQAEKALHQSVNLTSQLLTFSKGGKPLRKTIDLRPVIENAVKFALSGSPVSYDISFSDDLSLVEADAGQIGQVIQNIVLNAEQSMPLGGRIEIAARNVPVSRAAGHSLSPTDGLVEIVIRDQGMGIPREHLPRIFDPYFTTKEKGSGLGLATSYSIVRNHDGMIEVSSELGKGSTFTVYLPANRSALQPAELSAAVAGRTASRRERVLVMDDEEIVRIVAAELLLELGYEAEFAEHGNAAIEKYKQAKAEGRPFDIVILDLTIRGGKGGAETARELLAIDPEVKVVVSSGYSDDEIVASFQQHGFCSFLKKPYDMQDLAKVLANVMA